MSHLHCWKSLKSCCSHLPSSQTSTILQTLRNQLTPQPFTQIHWNNTAQQKVLWELFQLIIALKSFCFEENCLWKAQSRAREQSSCKDLLQGLGKELILHKTLILFYIWYESHTRILNYAKEKDSNEILEIQTLGICCQSLATIKDILSFTPERTTWDHKLTYVVRKTSFRPWHQTGWLTRVNFSPRPPQQIVNECLDIWAESSIQCEKQKSSVRAGTQQL